MLYENDKYCQIRAIFMYMWEQVVCVEGKHMVIHHNHSTLALSVLLFLVLQSSD